MRVNIYPRDDTDDIITTVKNFFGLYDGNGVSFEDKEHNTLIASYENFAEQMVVYVRVVDDAGSPSTHNSPRRPRLGPAFEMTSVAADISRPSSRTTHKKRSMSPQAMPGHRSLSTASRSRLSKRSKSAHGDLADADSDSDTGYASVTSSRRGKIDVVASAEISVDNIVEGSRRHKRARFDSSVSLFASASLKLITQELPLFVPSQVPLPGSVSSVSPQRRIGPNASPYQYSNPGQLSSFGFLASPQSFGMNDGALKNGNFSNGFPRRQGYTNGRTSISGPSGQMMPTPDPTTVGSVISDEDVALQLMRLGDASNFSAHGRTSTSTVDDALSGRADASSSGETDYSGDEIDHYDGETDESTTVDKNALMKVNKSLSRIGKPGLKRPGPGKHRKSSSTSSAILSGAVNFQHFQHRTPLAEDEEDLSSKPRCQRCRKSKKGCDRQRPCGRCKDAGIGIEGCVSEEETNGRKGRYGRHMGVSIKKDGQDGTFEQSMSPLKHEDDDMDFAVHAEPKLEHVAYEPMASMSMAPPPLMNGDKSRKRKR
jgi:hypothetical protein